MSTPLTPHRQYALLLALSKCDYQPHIDLLQEVAEFWALTKEQVESVAKIVEQVEGGGALFIQALSKSSLFSDEVRFLLHATGADTFSGALTFLETSLVGVPF